MVTDEIFRRRAERLASRPDEGAAAATDPILILRFGEERYGIPLSSLVEVLPCRGCTAVPGAPEAVLGVTNVRGSIRLVVDLGRLLTLAPSAGGASGYVVMVRRGSESVGLKVDVVDEVRQVDRARLRSAEPIAGARFAAALAGDTMMLVDVNAALDSLGIADQ